MTLLHITLEDGFSGHTVAIDADTRRVYNQQGVATDLRISRADAVDVDVPGTHVHVKVSVEPGNLQAAMDVDARATPYLCVGLDESGAIQLSPSAQMPRFM
jgi:hypothetical protein